MGSTKQIKLQSKYRKLKTRKDECVPELRMSGTWLSNAGFEIGDLVSIEITNNSLIIKKSK